MFTNRLFYLLIVVAFMTSMVTATPAQAASTIVVPGDYPTIQAAVDAAPPGATIKVRNGTYTEQLVLAKDLTLVGDGVDKTIVRAPSILTPYAVLLLNQAPVVAVVLITDGADVNISGLTVTGPIPCGVVSTGIRAVKDATLTLRDSHVTRIRSESSTCSGFVRGSGVGVGHIGIIQMMDGQRGSTGHEILTGVTVDKYQDLGIDIVGPVGAPSTATVFNNTITGGASPFRPVGQNGIFLQGAIVAQVKENTISGNVCTFPGCGRDPISQGQSAGILALTAAEILENYVSDNDIGIYQLQSSNPSTIRGNTLVNNRFFGIVIQDGDGATNQNNIKGGEVGIAVVADSQDTVGVLRGDKINQTSVMSIQEIDCCGFIATAIIEDD